MPNAQKPGRRGDNTFDKLRSGSRRRYASGRRVGVRRPYRKRAGSSLRSLRSLRLNISGAEGLFTKRVRWRLPLAGTEAGATAAAGSLAVAQASLPAVLSREKRFRESVLPVAAASVTFRHLSDS